jgi:diguanylate cyclase (GGDEF)-like protein
MMNILIAEHESSHTVLERLVRTWGYSASTAHDVNAVWAAFYGAEVPTCLILDCTMPNMDSKQLCARIRSRQGAYVYILLITDAERTQDIVDGLSAGADDYITRPFDGRELRVRLRVAQRILDLERELAASREALQSQALRDAETGLWNRATLREILERETNRARREKIPLSVVLLHLQAQPGDDPTDANRVGTMVKSAAHRIRRCVRSYDDVGRFAQDQLLLILPGCDAERAEMVCGRLERAVLDETAELGAGASAFGLGLSVATLTPGEAVDVEGLLHRVSTTLP